MRKLKLERYSEISENNFTNKGKWVVVLYINDDYKKFYGPYSTKEKAQMRKRQYELALNI